MGWTCTTDTAVHTCLRVLCQHGQSTHNILSRTHLFACALTARAGRAQQTQLCTPACLFPASMGSTCTPDPAVHSVLLHSVPLHTCAVLLHTYNTTGVHTCLPVLQTCTTHLPACSLPAWAQHAQQTQLHTVYYYTPVQYYYTLIILQVYTPVCLFSASMGSRLPMPPRGDFQPEISHRHCRSCVRRLCKQM